MLKDMDFVVYGKGFDGYIHYSLAMDRIQEEEESRKALMDEFDNDVDETVRFLNGIWNRSVFRKVLTSQPL